MRTITTTVKDIKATLTFKGTKGSKWGATRSQHHRLTVNYSNKRAYFDFWMSQAQPEIKDENDVLGALSCVLRDAHSAYETLDNFVAEFGYELREGRSIYNACVKSLEKLERLGMNEEFICDVLNEELSEL